MDTTESFPIDRREYHLKPWYVAIYAGMGSVFLLMGLLVIIAYPVKSLTKPAGIFKSLFFILVPLFMILWPLRYRLIVRGSRIELRQLPNYPNPNCADLRQIVGFRVTNRWGRGGKHIALFCKDGWLAIQFSAYLKTDDAYRKWMEQIPDLDARDREENLKRKNLPPVA